MSDNEKKTPNIIVTKEILSILPHRYPFVMVDRILDFDPGKSITGLKNITINEPFFQGHFPCEPIMPGVLIVEGMAQCSGILAHESGLVNNGVCFISAIDSCRFRGVVRPGDQIVFEISVTKLKASVGKFSCKAYVDSKLVAEAEIMLLISKGGL